MDPSDPEKDNPEERKESMKTKDSDSDSPPVKENPDDRKESTKSKDSDSESIPPGKQNPEDRKESPKSRDSDSDSPLGKENEDDRKESKKSKDSDSESIPVKENPDDRKESTKSKDSDSPPPGKENPVDEKEKSSDREDKPVVVEETAEPSKDRKKTLKEDTGETPKDRKQTLKEDTAAKPASKEVSKDEQEKSARKDKSHGEEETDDMLESSGEEEEEYSDEDESQEDIARSKEPTLEELEKQAELERINEEILAKREVIRSELRKLKSNYKPLVRRNSEIPEKQRLPREKFEMDPRIRAGTLLKQSEEMEEVYRKIEWRSLKSIIRCEKIEKNYLKEISTHHIIVKDLQHTTFVHTFRHRILTDKYWDIVEKNQIWKVEEEELVKSLEEEPEPEYVEPPEPVKRFYAMDLIGNFEGKKYDIKTIHAIRQLEDRLLKRYNRECEWAALNAAEIRDDYEDPKHNAAIKSAEENMGDYKLRSGDDYIGEQITIPVRRQRILDLKKMIFDELNKFNNYVILLKEEKQVIIDKCHQLQEEMKQLQKYIPIQLRKPIPFVHDMEGIEQPEQRYIITQERVDARKEKKIAALGFTKRRQAMLDKVSGSGVDSNAKPKRKIRDPMEFQLNWRLYKFNCQLAVEPEVEKFRKRQKHLDTYSKIQTNIKPPIGLVVPTGNEKAVKMDGLPNSIFRFRKAFYNPKSALAKERRDRLLTRRLLAQDKLLEHLQGIINYFKHRIVTVRDERTELAIDMKVAQLALMVRCEEFEIVKEFDAVERSVQERLRAQKVELNMAKDKLEKIKKRMMRAESDGGKVEVAINAVAKEVAVVIGEKPRFSEYLWKVYKKKIYVRPELSEDGDAEVSSGSSSSSSSGSSTSQDTNSDLFRPPKQKLDTSICPDGLDRNVFDRVCEFRTKRTQLETESESQKKVVERIRKDYDDVEKVYKKYQGRLDAIGDEAHTIQRVKQKRMNEIKGMVIVRSDQIQCLEDEDVAKEKMQLSLPSDIPQGVELEEEEDMSGAYGRFYRQFPPDFTDFLVFRNREIGKLSNTTQELKELTNKEKERQKGANQMKLRLQEELRHKEDTVKALVKAVHDDMRGKFGRLVDMDEVCACIINLEVLDALNKLETRRNRHYYERHIIEQEIEETKRHLTQVTKVNSEFNSLLAILEERRRDVDYFLYKQKKDTTNVHIKGESQVLVEQTNESVEKQLYELEYQLLRQQMKIETLRDTIAIAKGKTGIPPLISMHKIPDKYGDAFMTYDELRHYNHEINYQVETLYVKDHIMEHLGRSESNTPSFAGSPAVPAEDGSKMFEPQENFPGEEKLSIVDEEEEGQEVALEEEIPGEDDDFPYINILRDDQMPKSGEGTDYSEEENLEIDPIPVAKISVKQTSDQQQQEQVPETKEGEPEGE